MALVALRRDERRVLVVVFAKWCFLASALLVDCFFFLDGFCFVVKTFLAAFLLETFFLAVFFWVVFFRAVFFLIFLAVDPRRADPSWAVRFFLTAAFLTGMIFAPRLNLRNGRLYIDRDRSEASGQDNDEDPTVTRAQRLA